jgi:hypothetical protein
VPSTTSCSPCPIRPSPNAPVAAVPCANSSGMSELCSRVRASTARTPGARHLTPCPHRNPIPPHRNPTQENPTRHPRQVRPAQRAPRVRAAVPALPQPRSFLPSGGEEFAHPTVEPLRVFHEHEVRSTVANLEDLNLRLGVLRRDPALAISGEDAGFRTHDECRQVD